MSPGNLGELGCAVVGPAFGESGAVGKLSVDGGLSVFPAVGAGAVVGCSVTLIVVGAESEAGAIVAVGGDDGLAVVVGGLVSTPNVGADGIFECSVGCTVSIPGVADGLGAGGSDDGILLSFEAVLAALGTLVVSVG